MHRDKIKDNVGNNEDQTEKWDKLGRGKCGKKKKKKKKKKKVEIYTIGIRNCNEKWNTNRDNKENEK